MKFRITSSNWFADEVLSKYPCLKNYSFEWHEDEDRPPSHYSGYGVITINTLEDLIQLMNECDEPLIISKEPYGIEIYDGWRE